MNLHEDGGDAAAPLPAPLPTHSNNSRGAGGRGGKHSPSKTQSPARPNYAIAVSGAPASTATGSASGPKSEQQQQQQQHLSQHQLASRFRGVVNDMVALAQQNRDESMCDHFAALAEEAVKGFRGAKTDIRVQHRSPAFHRTNTSALGGSGRDNKPHPHSSGAAAGGGRDHHVDPAAARATDNHPSTLAPTNDSIGDDDNSNSDAATTNEASRASTPPPAQNRSSSSTAAADSPKPAAGLNPPKRSWASIVKNTDQQQQQQQQQQKSPQKAFPSQPAVSTASAVDSDNDECNTSKNKLDSSAHHARGEERRAEAEERRRQLAAEKQRKFEEQAARTEQVKERRDKMLERTRNETLEKAERHERARVEASNRKKDAVPESSPTTTSAAASTTAAAVGSVSPQQQQQQHQKDEEMMEAKHREADRKLEESAARRKEMAEEKSRVRQEKKEQLVQHQLVSAAIGDDKAQEQAPQTLAQQQSLPMTKDGQDSFAHRLSTVVTRHGKVFLESYAKEHGILSSTAAAAAASADSAMTTTTTGKKGGGKKAAASSAAATSAEASALAAHAMSTKCRFYTVLEKFRVAAASSNSKSSGSAGGDGEKEGGKATSSGVIAPAQSKHSSNSGVVLSRLTAGELSRALKESGNSSGSSSSSSSGDEKADHMALRINSPNVFEVLVNTIIEQRPLGADKANAEQQQQQQQPSPFELLHKLLLHPREGEKHLYFFCRSGIFVPLITMVFQEMMRAGCQLKASPVLRDALSILQLCSFFFMPGNETMSKAYAAAEMPFRHIMGEFLKLAECDKAIESLSQQLAPSSASSSSVTQMVVLETMQYVCMLLTLRMKQYSSHIAPDEMKRYLKALLNAINSVMLLQKHNTTNDDDDDHGEASNSSSNTSLPPLATQVLFSLLRLLNDVVRKNLSLAHGILADIEFRQMTYQAVSSFFLYVSKQDEDGSMAAQKIPAEPSSDKVRETSFEHGALSLSFLTAVDHGLTFCVPERPDAVCGAAETMQRLRAALHEVLLFCGYICLHNGTMQELFHYQHPGQKEMLLELLIDACPLEYLGGVSKHVLIPTLLCIGHRSRRNLTVLQKAQQLDNISEFLDAEIKARPSAARKQQRKAGKKHNTDKAQATPRPAPQSWADMADDDGEDDDDTATVDSNSTANTNTNHNGESMLTPMNSNMSAGSNSSPTPSAASDQFKAVAERKDRLTRSFETQSTYPQVHHFRLDRRFPMTQWRSAAVELAELKQQLSSPTS